MKLSFLRLDKSPSVDSYQGSSAPLRGKTSGFRHLAKSPGNFSRRTFFLFGAILLLSCSNAIRKLERETIIKRSANLSGFTGTYRESGLRGDEATTRISYRRNPAELYALRSYGKKTVSWLSASPGKLIIFYPKSSFGIRYSNLPVASAAHELQYLENEYDWHVAHYDIAQTENRQLAGRKAIGIRYSPKTQFSNEPFLFTWQAFADEEFAFPLMNTMLRNGETLYAVAFDKIEFNPPALPQIAEKPQLPRRATLAEYDYGGRNYSFAEAKAQANFALRMPKPIAGTEFNRIIRVAGIIPAFTFVAAEMPYITMYSQIRDYGLALIPEEGLKLQSRREYRVSFFGAFKTVWFKQAGIYHTIVSNRPLSEILTWLDETA